MLYNSPPNQTSAGRLAVPRHGNLAPGQLALEPERENGGAEESVAGSRRRLGKLLLLPITCR